MGEQNRNRAVAMIFVLAIHGMAAWVLRGSVPRPQAHDPQPLRVRWIERPRLPAPSPPPADVAIRNLPPPAEAAGQARRADAPATTPSPAPDVTAAPAMTPHDYLSQGTAWATQAAGPVDFRPGLADSRTPGLPGGARGGRFRMREPASPQRVLQAIGRMLAGPDYTPDPCPRLHDNVHGLLPDTRDTGRRRLQWELREYRERCRP